jgi:hypothetical protein
MDNVRLLRAVEESLRHAQGSSVNLFGHTGISNIKFGKGTETDILFGYGSKEFERIAGELGTAFPGEDTLRAAEWGQLPVVGQARDPFL